MATNQKIATTELDFDAIKQNLKTYLQGQSEFTDYDFEGSGLSILLDILAYNTHYNALYTNLAINEAFLDSASKRSSVVSKASELGYVPASAKSAVAKVNVTMINNSLQAPPQQSIPRYATFSSIVDDVTYTFYTLDSYSAVQSGTQYIFQDVVLYEGTLLEYRYVIGQQARLILPNQNIDLSTLAVTVQQNSQSGESEVYLRSDQLLDVSSTSKVYFIKEIADQLYELEFGNGVVGAALSAGNVVTVRYLVSNAAGPNRANVFVYTQQPPAQTTVSVTTTTPATGGAAPEDVDQIKWNAPRAYATQNRCVTAEDYKSVIMRLYPEAKSISVWGGETATPPQYGKVYISIIPKTTTLVSQTDKDFIIQTIINPRKSLTITPEIVDPTFVNIQLDTTVYYNPQRTTRTSTDIATLVRNTIANYNNNTLNTFEGVLKFSRLSTLIDQTESSIVSNITTVKIHREVQPNYNVTSPYTINLGNPIYQSGFANESILSSGFISTDSDRISFIDNDPDASGSDIGNLRLFYLDSLGQKVVLRTVGTVQYSTGLINITDLNISRLTSTSWNFVIVPQSNDVASTFNQFVQIIPALTTVRVIVDTPSSNYTFTPSRT